MKPRLRRLTELFVQGKAVKLPDDNGYLWVQVVNSFERDECVSDAQVARARLVMALKEQGSERIKVESRLAEVGRDEFLSDLAKARATGKSGEFVEEMRDDPEWSERLLIMLRTDEDTNARNLSAEEQQVMEQIQAEVINELMKREREEEEFLLRKFERLSDEDLVSEWVEEWIDKRGTGLAQMEFQLTELWYATRYCEALPNEDGELEHSRCDGHRERVFETKNDARSAPTALTDILREALNKLNIGGRDPKGSGSPESSSGSSPTPNAPVESTPSTSTETPSTPPGT